MCSPTALLLDNFLSSNETRIAVTRITLHSSLSNIIERVVLAVSLTARVARCCRWQPETRNPTPGGSEGCLISVFIVRRQKSSSAGAALYYYAYSGVIIGWADLRKLDRNSGQCKCKCECSDCRLWMMCWMISRNNPLNGRANFFHNSVIKAFLHQPLLAAI